MHLVLGLAMIQSCMEAERLLLMGIAAPRHEVCFDYRTSEHPTIH